MNKTAFVLASIIVLSLVTATPMQAQDWKTSVNPIERVRQSGLMSGYPDGKFHPEGMISRAEVAHIVVKAFDVNKRDPQYTSDFKLSDVPTSYWAYNDIQSALRHGVMMGYHNDGRFYPNQKITRAEAYAIFAQAYGVFSFTPQTQQEVLSQYPDASKIPGWAKQAMATALHEGFVNTDEQAKRIHPLEPMTRGDMAFALNRYMQRQYDTNQPH